MITQASVPSVRVDALLEDDPIEPSWVLEGEPRARSTVWATSPDQTACNWVWDCTAGRFRWYFELDETVVVIDGEARIEVDGQDPVTLRVGDGMYFPGGTWATWTVERYVRKQAVLRVPVPRAMAHAVSAFGRRTNRLR